MAVVFEEVTSNSLAFTTPVVDFELTIPAGTEAGDVLIALVFNGTANKYVSTPSGWTLEDEYTLSETYGRYQIFSREAEDGDASEVVAFTPSITYMTITGVMLRISGGDSTDITIGLDGTRDTSDYTPTCPSINVPNNGSLLLRTVASERNSTFTGPAGYDEEIDTVFGVNDNAQAVYSKQDAVDAGSTGTVDITASPTYHDEHCVATISIGPASAAASIIPKVMHYRRIMGVA